MMNRLHNRLPSSLLQSSGFLENTNPLEGNAPSVARQFDLRRRSRKSGAVLVTLLLLVVSVSACSKEDDKPDPEEQSRRDAIVQLQEGYSLLYSSISGLKFVDKAFLIKFENDRTQKIVTEVSDFSGELAKELESWADTTKTVKIDLDPLPEFEKRKLAAVSKDRLLSFAPIVGRTGANFQRTLLLSQSGALNQMRHLATVIAEGEPNEARATRMHEVSDQFDDLYDQVVVVLNDLYFCDNDPEPSIKEGG